MHPSEKGDKFRKISRLRALQCRKAEEYVVPNFVLNRESTSSCKNGLSSIHEEFSVALGPLLLPMQRNTVEKNGMDELGSFTRSNKQNHLIFEKQSCVPVV